MKIDPPVLPSAMPAELQLWLDKVSDLLNKGFYAPKIFTTAPTLTQMLEGEFAIGAGTGPAGVNELFAKVSSTAIARFRHDATIT